MFKINTLQDFKILQKSNVGIECEFSTELTLKQASESLSQFLNENIKPVDDLLHTFEKSSFILAKDWSKGEYHFEFITHPLPYFEAKGTFINFMKWVRKNNDIELKSFHGVHINVSFNDIDLPQNINKHKLAIKFLEKDIYQDFPQKKSSLHTKDLLDIGDNLIISLDSPSSIKQLDISQDSYRTVNLNKLKSNYLEVKMIGGSKYASNLPRLSEIFDEIILSIFDSTSSQLSGTDIENYQEKLTHLVEKSKAFSNPDKFREAYPKVELSVDLEINQQAVNAYFSKIASSIKKILPPPGQTSAKINYDSDIPKVQVKDMYNMNVDFGNNIDFYNCKLKGVFEDCNFKDSLVRSSFINNSLLKNSEIKYDKITNSKIYNSRGADNLIIRSEIDNTDKLTNTILKQMNNND